MMFYIIVLFYACLYCITKYLPLTVYLVYTVGYTKDKQLETSSKKISLSYKLFLRGST